MFSYYGGKSKIIDLYPPPKYGKIIEPFAGSARYSLKYWDREITLVDKFDKIVRLWNYLKTASQKDILGLPNVKTGEDLRGFDLIDEEKYLIGFCIGRGNSYPTHKGGAYNNWERDKVRISNSLHKIRHWVILEGDYANIPNEESTWFIDPPYEFGGHKYKHPFKDFTNLANWIYSRHGQCIVCENTKASWLPFKPMADMIGCQFKTTEAIWSNMPTNYDNTQLTLL